MLILAALNTLDLIKHKELLLSVYYLCKVKHIREVFLFMDMKMITIFGYIST